MQKRLIVNADDFGLTHGVNRAVAELHDAGALTSATLMACGPAFQDAVALARARPTLGIGCHVVLTDGMPSAAVRSIPSLVAGEHALRPKLMNFAAALLLNQIDPAEIEREAIAQIRRVQAAGLQVTHLDTHKHTHIFPQVLKPLLRAASQTGVTAIRNPFEQPWAFPLSNGTAARTSQIRVLAPLKRSLLHQPQIASGQIRTTDGAVGVSATGHLNENTLRNLLNALPNGTWELVCHPGYNDDELNGIVTRLRESREVERQALLAVFGDLRKDESSSSPANLHAPALIHYGDL